MNRRRQATGTFLWIHRASVGLSLLIAGILAFPWPPPVPDVQITWFDPALITIDPQGALTNAGRVQIRAQEIVLSALPYSQPTVHLLTAEVPFTVACDVVVRERSPRDVFPFQLKVWNPKADVAAEIWFAPDGTVMAGTRVHDRWREVRRLGTYAVGETYILRISRENSRIILEARSRAEGMTFTTLRETFPGLFTQETLSLTVYASSPHGGMSTTVLGAPVISVPAQTRYGTTVRARWYRGALGLGLALSLFWVTIWARKVRPRLRLSPADAWGIAVLTGAVLLVGWWLVRIPGHPVDVRTTVVWSAIARDHGLAAIPGYSLVATEGQAHSGQPYASMAYPYPPLITYPLWIAGKVADDNERVPQVFKMLMVLGLAVAGAGLFSLLRHMRVTGPAALAATAAFVLNPAILFATAVWGQTDVMVALALLAAAGGIVRQSAPLFWVGALLAYLTKQTGGLFVPVLLIVGVRWLGIRRMVAGLPVAIVLAFLVVSPALLSGLHPSALYRPVATKVLAFGTVQHMEEINATVSQSGFTVWSALAALEGARGWARLAFPDYVATSFGASYFVLSRLLFAACVLVLGVLAFRRSNAQQPGEIFLTLAAYAVAAAVLLTRVQPRYLYFGVLFAAASLPWVSLSKGTAAMTVLSGTMLVGMWGMLVFTSAWYPGSAPFFEPERSWLNGTMATALSSDVGITLGGLLNTAVLLMLLAILWKRPYSTHPGILIERRQNESNE